MIEKSVEKNGVRKGNRKKNTVKIVKKPFRIEKRKTLFK